MVDLWHVVFVGRRISEVSVSQVEQQVDYIRPISHLSETFFVNLQASIFGSDDVEQFVGIEFLQLLYLGTPA